MKSLFILAVLTVVMLGTTQSSYADVIVFTANLSGAAEDTPNASPGTGFTTVTYDSTAHTLRVQVTFSGLVANNTAAHIHSATAVPGAGLAGVATSVPTFTGFPTGTMSGTYDNTFNLTLASSWNPSFITANGGTTASAEAALFLGMTQGRAYLNIHSISFPGGEIRGFLQPVPEPTTILLLGSGLAGIASSVRRRRKAIKNNEA